MSLIWLLKWTLCGLWNQSVSLKRVLGTYPWCTQSIRELQVTHKGVIQHFTWDGASELSWTTTKANGNKDTTNEWGKKGKGLTLTRICVSYGASLTYRDHKVRCKFPLKLKLGLFLDRHFQPIGILESNSNPLFPFIHFLQQQVWKSRSNSSKITNDQTHVLTYDIQHSLHSNALALCTLSHMTYDGSRILSINNL